MIEYLLKAAEDSDASNANKQRGARVDMEVVRTWKRDGSRNLMAMPAAIGNIASNAGLPPAEVRERLLAGEVLETRLARFELWVVPDAIVRSASNGVKHKDIL